MTTMPIPPQSDNSSDGPGHIDAIVIPEVVNPTEAELKLRVKVERLVGLSLNHGSYVQTSRFQLMGVTFAIDLADLEAALKVGAGLFPYGMTRGDVLIPQWGRFIKVVDRKENPHVIGDLFSPAPTLAPVGCDWPVPDLMPGVTVLLGDTGSGKTFYVRNVLHPDLTLRFSEPLEPIDGENQVVTMNSLLTTLETAIVYSALGLTVAIDSLRMLVYSLSGAAMEGGMSAALFDTITTLNNLFASVGGNVAVVVNPLLSDPTKADRLFTRIAASCAGAIHLRDREVADATFRLSSGRELHSQSAPGVTKRASADFPPTARGDSTAGIDEGVTRSIVASIGREPSARPSDIDSETPRTFARFTL